MQNKRDAQGIYLPEKIDCFARAIFNRGSEDTKPTPKALQAWMGPALDRFRAHDMTATDHEDNEVIVTELWERAEWAIAHSNGNCSMPRASLALFRRS